MKYQFTTEGSKPQTKYHLVEIRERYYDKDGNLAGSITLFKTVVSTPLIHQHLKAVLSEEMGKNPHCENMDVEVYDGDAPKNEHPQFQIVGLDSIYRIISNIKPIKVKVRVSIDGDAKTYTIDAEKLDTLLKSLE